MRRTHGQFVLGSHEKGTSTVSLKLNWLFQFFVPWSWYVLAMTGGRILMTSFELFRQDTFTISQGLNWSAIMPRTTLTDRIFSPFSLICAP